MDAARVTFQHDALVVVLFQKGEPLPVGAKSGEAVQELVLADPQKAGDGCHILILDPDSGAVVGRYGGYGRDAGELSLPLDLAVRADGTVVFAISDAPLNFHRFARLFRDVLETPDALFLDGNISRLYAPMLDRHDLGFPMGPILGVVVESGS